MTKRPQVPPGLQGGGRGVVETPHGSPHMGLSPQARASRKEKMLCGKRNISCWGSCCFLSQTGIGPQKRLKVLPFDPREPVARRSQTAALRAAPQSSRQTCHSQTQSRPSSLTGSPRLPGTSGEIAWIRGPFTALVCRRGYS